MYDVLVVEDYLMQHDEWILVEQECGLTLLVRKSVSGLSRIDGEARRALGMLGKAPASVIPMPRRSVEHTHPSMR